MCSFISRSRLFRLALTDFATPANESSAAVFVSSLCRRLAIVILRRRGVWSNSSVDQSTCHQRIYEPAESPRSAERSSKAACAVLNRRATEIFLSLASGVNHTGQYRSHQ